LTLSSIKKVQEDSPGLIQTIRQSVSAANAARLRRAAHSLKGLAANFGAASVLGPALRLEEMGKLGQLEGAEQLISELQREIERLDQALTPYRGSDTIEPPTAQV
jgi:HPt (histidine-containing phosphotransfer) domain-containing protein